MTESVFGLYLHLHPTINNIDELFLLQKENYIQKFSTKYIIYEIDQLTIKHLIIYCVHLHLLLYVLLEYYLFRKRKIHIHIPHF